MYKKIFLLVLIFGWGLTPLSVTALCYQMASYGPSSQEVPRTPLFNIQIFNGDRGCFPIATKEDVTTSAYSNGIQFLFDLMIGASIAIAVILFTYGAAQGIFYTVSSKEITAGRKRMYDSIVGLLIILGMWLVINTVNPDLLRLPILQGLYEIPNPSTSKANSQTGVTIGPGNGVSEIVKGGSTEDTVNFDESLLLLGN